MATIPCPHPSPLSESQDWYRPQTPSPETRPVSGYEIKKRLRHRHVKRSYVSKILAMRRRKIYDEAVALLLAERHVAAPALPVVDIRQRFREQAEKWDRETAHMSSPLQKMMHPSYQAILGMSAESLQNKQDIIRFMLHDLKTNHREWSLALSYLTQHNPINPKDYGRTDKINAAWIKWGNDQGLM